MRDKNFKECNVCKKFWHTRDEFLSDPEVELVGYQVHWEELELGLLYFNHSCGTTMAVEVSEFKDLYQGEIFPERAVGSPECPGHCLHSNNLKPCPARCECAYVREIIQIIRKWNKKAK